MNHGCVRRKHHLSFRTAQAEWIGNSQALASRHGAVTPSSLLPPDLIAVYSMACVVQLKPSSVCGTGGAIHVGQPTAKTFNALERATHGLFSGTYISTTQTSLLPATSELQPCKEIKGRWDQVCCTKNPVGSC